MNDDMASVERRGAERAAREGGVAEAGAAELAAIEGRQRAVLDAALDCVISMDRGGLITYFNAAAERTFGRDADEVIGLEMAEVIVPPSLRDGHREGLARHLRTGESRVLDRRIELQGMRANGSEFPVELTVTRVELGDEPGFTAYIRDITERKQAEENLIAAEQRLKLVAAEQAALRRVATLVARGAVSGDVFDAVCEETGRLIEATNVNLAHFTPAGTNLTVASWSLHGNHIPRGTELPLEGETINAMVQRTKAPAHVDSYDAVSGELAELIRKLGVRSEIAAPVVIDGHVWGALVAGSDKSEPLSQGTESRLANFAELIATAVSNATARAELIAASRRVIEAGDAARRGVTRDLHDGAQQQFVNSVINLQLAQQKWTRSPGRANELLNLGITEAAAGIEALRELAAGIHPAILTDRGLAAAVEALVKTMPVSTEVDIAEVALPASMEASVYFFCSEALTNVVKHARATSARVQIEVEDSCLLVEIEDDGIGGAAPRSDGIGLTSMSDRVAALDGHLELRSPEAGGTSLRASIPLQAEVSA
jgi:PAS domain S-box-containing protein